MPSSSLTRYSSTRRHKAPELVSAQKLQRCGAAFAPRNPRRSSLMIDGRLNWNVALDPELLDAQCVRHTLR
jgi:hypothetical protein